jgi:dipeptidyl-peptidase-4
VDHADYQYHQNQQELYVIDVNSGKSRKVLTETDPVYLELHDGLYFFKSGDRFLWPSWRDGHTHLYLYSLNAKDTLAADAKLVNQVTKGEWEMLSLEGEDERNGVIYFTSNKDDDRQQQLYSVKLDGSQMKQITKEPGSHMPSMPDNTQYYIDRYSSLLKSLRMNLCATNGACNEIFQAPDLAKIFDYEPPQFIDFKAEDGTLLRGAIVLPKSGTAMKDGKFPLIMNPYGGPQIQTIRDAMGTVGMLDQYFVKQGIAVLKVDNRGMYNRGRNFAIATYKNLGEIELKDQLASLDQALAKFPQLDQNRLGFWGWSYGASMTLNALTHSNRFKAGVAVAPVSDWHLYDTAYTERYMSLPQDNAAGYDKASFVRAAGNLSGRLLIVHGTSDDNVHMQNTIQFTNALINAGKQFDMQLYPQKTHGIGGPQARTHLYSRIAQQFEDALGK